MTRVQIKKICDTLDLKYVRKLETKKTVDYYTNLLINILMRESIIQATSSKNKI